MALLNKPQLLILDEPTNGLDPAGIHEMRDLIRRLPIEFGVTVFLSSHLLSVVEQIASHIGIIHEGSLLFQGPLAELQNRQQTYLRVGVKQLEQAITCLLSAGWEATASDQMLNVVTKNPNDAVEVNRMLIERGLEVFHLEIIKASLEDIFLTLTATETTGRKAA